MANPPRRTPGRPAMRSSQSGRGQTGQNRAGAPSGKQSRTTSPAQRGKRQIAAAPRGGAVARSSTGPRVGRPERRQAVVLAAVLIVLLAFSGRLVQVQALEGNARADDALADRMSSSVLHALRGDIVDTNGVVLATSVERFDVVVDQTLIANFKLTDGSVVLAEGPAGAAQLLAPVLGLDAGELGAKLVGDRRWVRIAAGVTPEVWRQVRELRISGVSSERAAERLYPAGSVAGNLVGFLGADGVALAGLELVNDEQLTGINGKHTFERDANRVAIPGGVEHIVPAVPGAKLHLTIDRDLTYQVAKLLNEAVAESGARWGAVQVTDVKTGEILALVDSNAVDPNNPGATPASDRRSRAVEAVYEPGSTAKVITMAAALETGVATPGSRFVVPDNYRVENGQSFKDSVPHRPLKLTLAGILSESSNTGTVMVGERLPREVRHEYLTKFGLGKRTNIGLPGESAGILHPAEKWDRRSEYAVLFGQAVSVTTLQATQVFATLGNGGVHVQPHLVKGWTLPDGTYQEAKLPPPTRVVSQETADAVVNMLESAVVEGTGGRAAVPGYRVAGKTGTAQAFEGGGVITTVASFIGVAPANDPRIAVNVVLYAPRSSIYGGAVAAPVFSQVAGYALQRLAVPPNDEPASLFPTSYE